MEQNQVFTLKNLNGKRFAIVLSILKRERVLHYGLNVAKSGTAMKR
jgi:hypothetical protein